MQHVRLDYAWEQRMEGKLIRRDSVHKNSRIQEYGQKSLGYSTCRGTVGRPAKHQQLRVESILTSTTCDCDSGSSELPS